MLRLNLKPSRQLTACLVAGHGIAAACVLRVPLPFWLCCLLLIALSLSLLYQLTYQAWRILPFSIVALQFEREGDVYLQYRNGAGCTVRVLGSSFVTPYLTIILLKSNRAWFARSVVVMPDMLTGELFRRLRVWLKWRLGHGVEPGAEAVWAGRV